MMKLYGSIEGGGTKFVCAIGNEQLEVMKKVVFKTTSPEETLAKVIQFLKRNRLKQSAWGCSVRWKIGKVT